MKLRRSFSPHQLFFAVALGWSLALPGAMAQDRITTKDGRTQEVKIVGVSGSNIQIQVGAGSIGVPMRNIASITMAAPPEFAQAEKAYDAKDYKKALTATKALVDKFKGLPVDWAREATGRLGDIYVALDQLPEAEKAYLDFQKIYGGQGGSPQSEVGLARIALSKKDYAQAKSKLEPVTTKALSEKQPPANLTTTYSQAFYLLGQVNEAENDYPAALENYLRTVTLFYHDNTAAAAAQQRADALREAHGTKVP